MKNCYLQVRFKQLNGHIGLLQSETGEAQRLF